MKKLLLFLVGLLTAISAYPARADCAADGDLCRLTCERRLGREDQEAARAGCVARCATDRAACVAQSVIDDAARAANRDVVPWIDRQTDRARALLDGFWRRGGANPDESKTKGGQL